MLQCLLSDYFGRFYVSHNIADRFLGFLPHLRYSLKPTFGVDHDVVFHGFGLPYERCIDVSQTLRRLLYGRYQFVDIHRAIAPFYIGLYFHVTAHALMFF
jgi:hypothetical protein